MPCDFALVSGVEMLTIGLVIFLTMVFRRTFLEHPRWFRGSAFAMGVGARMFLAALGVFPTTLIETWTQLNAKHPLKITEIVGTVDGLNDVHCDDGNCVRLVFPDDKMPESLGGKKIKVVGQFYRQSRKVKCLVREVRILEHKCPHCGEDCKGKLIKFKGI